MNMIGGTTGLRGAALGRGEQGGGEQPDRRRDQERGTQQARRVGASQRQAEARRPRRAGGRGRASPAAGRGGRGSRGRSAASAAASRRPGSRLSQKIQRQPRAPAIAPPTTGPSAAATPVHTVHAPTDRRRSLRWDAAAASRPKRGRQGQPRADPLHGAAGDQRRGRRGASRRRPTRPRRRPRRPRTPPGARAGRRSRRRPAAGRSGRAGTPGSPIPGRRGVRPRSRWTDGSATVTTVPSNNTSAVPVVATSRAGQTSRSEPMPDGYMNAGRAPAQPGWRRASRSHCVQRGRPSVPAMRCSGLIARA